MSDDVTVPVIEERRVKRYGWKPSLPDPRDHIADASGIKILPEVDPRHEMPPIVDQGQLGSCTANAVARAVEYDLMLNTGSAADALSRLFLYYGERQYEGTLGQGDTGAFGRDGFKVAKNIGVPEEKLWPYLIERFEEKPPRNAYADAPHHRIKGYKAVPQHLQSIKAVLSNKQTVAFGFTVFESFESEQVAKTGIVPMPEPGEKQVGGHEVLGVGYLKHSPEYALVDNSWSEGWGIGGRMLFPWAYLLDRQLAGDLRTIPRPVGK